MNRFQQVSNNALAIAKFAPEILTLSSLTK